MTRLRPQGSRPPRRAWSHAGSSSYCRSRTRLPWTRFHVKHPPCLTWRGGCSVPGSTSRAVAPLPRLLEWSMPLVREGGELVAMKGASAAEEVRTAAKDLAKSGGGPVEVLTLGKEVVNPPTTVIRVGSARPSALGYGS